MAPVPQMNRPLCLHACKELAWLPPYGNREHAGIAIDWFTGGSTICASPCIPLLTGMARILLMWVTTEELLPAASTACG